MYSKQYEPIVKLPSAKGGPPKSKLRDLKGGRGQKKIKKFPY